MKKKLTISRLKESLPEGYNFKAELTDAMMKKFERDLLAHLPPHYKLGMKKEKKGDLNVISLNLPEEWIQTISQAIDQTLFKDTPKRHDN